MLPFIGTGHAGSYRILVLALAGALSLATVHSVFEIGRFHRRNANSAKNSATRWSALISGDQCPR